MIQPITTTRIWRFLVTGDFKYAVFTDAEPFTVKVLDLQAGAVVRKLAGAAAISGLFISPESKYVLVQYDGAPAQASTLSLWSLDTGEIAKSFSLPAGLVASFFPDGRAPW